MLVTTLNKIRECDPCAEGWETLLSFLGKTKADNDPLTFLTIIESNGFDDALWCMRAAPEYEKEWKIFALWCASAKAEARAAEWTAVSAEAGAEASAAAWDAASYAVSAEAWDSASAAQEKEFIKIISGLNYVCS